MKNCSVQYSAKWKSGIMPGTNERRYYFESIEFCCPEMERAWKENFIGFGDDYEYNHIKHGHKVLGLCVYVCIPYPEGPIWEHKTIRFCPWCGAPIVLVLCKQDMGEAT